MATITIDVTASGESVTLTKTISAPDLLRFIAAYRAIFKVPSATDNQVVALWQQSVIDAARMTVRTYEQQSAASSASAGVVDITLA